MCPSRFAGYVKSCIFPAYDSCTVTSSESALFFQNMAERRACLLPSSFWLAHKTLPKSTRIVLMACLGRLLHLTIFYPSKICPNINQLDLMQSALSESGYYITFDSQDPLSFFYTHRVSSRSNKKTPQWHPCAPRSSHLLYQNAKLFGNCSEDSLPYVHPDTISFPKSLKLSVMSSSSNTRAMSLAQIQVYIKTTNLTSSSLSLTRETSEG